MKIEKNIPIPKSKAGKPLKYGIVDEMNVGDSILCTGNTEAIGCLNRGLLKGYKMLRRKVDVICNEDKIRVWRIE